MQSKIIIFVVFAALAQNSFAQLSKVYGLSKDRETLFDQTIRNQEASVAAKFNEFNPVSNILEEVSAKFSIENSSTVLTYRLQAAVGGVFATVEKYLRKIGLGIPATSNHDDARAKTVVDCEAALRALVDSIVEVNPDASTAAADIWELFAIGSEQISVRFYDAIDLALSQNTTYAKALKDIETFKNQTLSEVPGLISAIVELIRNGDSWNDYDTAKVTALQEDANTAAGAYESRTFDGIKILLKAVYKTPPVSANDFVQVKILWSLAFSGIRDFSNKIKAIRLIALEADNSK